MAAEAAHASKGAMQKVLDVVERVGNKVPHPVVIFLILIAFVIVLSHIFYAMGVAISWETDPGHAWPYTRFPGLMFAWMRTRQYPAAQAG